MHRREYLAVVFVVALLCVPLVSLWLQRGQPGVPAATGTPATVQPRPGPGGVQGQLLVQLRPGRGPEALSKFGIRTPAGNGRGLARLGVVALSVASDQQAQALAALRASP